MLAIWSLVPLPLKPVWTSGSSQFTYCWSLAWRIWGTTLLACEKAMAPYSSTLAWEIPWMEEPGGLQPMGSLRFGHDWATSLSLLTFMYWRRKWQPTHSSVFAWRIPGTGKPGGLPSMGSHRVGHNWSDLAAARWVQLCGSLSILSHCLSLGLEWKLTFSSPVATAEFSKCAGILSVEFHSIIFQDLE